MAENGEPRRAITLGGGGPAAGLHIGVLEALAEKKIKFKAWSLSCIGAWVGVVYNQSKEEREEDKVKATYEFFRDGVFRDDEGYRRFPINSVFGPDWRSNIEAWNEFVRDPENYKEFQWQPYKMFDYFQESLSIVADHMPSRKRRSFKRIDEGDINRWILNQVMAPNPFIRYLTSMMYLSNLNGLSRINYPDSDFMKKIDFGELSKPDKPFIFHNAWDLDRQELAFFANRQMKAPKNGEYKGAITARSLCACSALPFVEGTVEIDGTTYCEGALVDTVNFEGLVDLEVEGKKLDEIWISRIVDSQQIRKPENLHDALANLCQLFAATVGEDDVRLFKYHVQYDAPKWEGTVVEIHVPGHINFKWNHSNLNNGRELGRRAALQAIKKYESRGAKTAGRPNFVNQKSEAEADPEWQKVRKIYEEMKDAAE